MSQCSGPNESKYLAISSPSEAVSASIHMIHIDQACIWTRKGGGAQ